MLPGSSLFEGGIEPPRPRFHPVPTRPVFAPRDDLTNPQFPMYGPPIGDEPGIDAGLKSAL